jgi:hypothetical protein
VTGLAGLCLAAAAHADVVTFDDIDIAPAPYGNFADNLFDGGLHFADQTFAIGTTSFDRPVFTTTQFMETGSSVVEPLTISLDDGGLGGAFNLNGFRMGLGDWNDQAMGGYDLVTITGQKSADCVNDCADPTVTVHVGYNWTLYDLSGFTGLSSVTVSQPTFIQNGLPAIDPNTGTTTDYGWLAFDDINYATDPTGGVGQAGGPAVGVQAFPGPIPEPAAWALMIAGFGAVGAALRRRRATGLAAA